VKLAKATTRSGMLRLPIVCKQIVANEITVTGDYERAGNDDSPWRLCLERGDDFAALDAAQQMIQDRCGDDHDGGADRDAGSAPGAADGRLGK